MTREPLTLTCYCCGIAYERGKFRCCAPRGGMTAVAWQEQWCRVDLGDGKRCNSCPRCGCAHRAAHKFSGSEIGMSTPADLAPKTRGELRARVKEWMPYRESREVGEEG